jgi:hypothetical protein
VAWNWRIDSEVAGISALCAADAPGFVSAFCPSLFTMRASATKGGYTASETAADIYRGLAIGGALALVAGLGGSAVTRSWWPLASTLLALSVILIAFTWALNTPRLDSQSMESQ